MCLALRFHSDGAVLFQRCPGERTSPWSPAGGDSGGETPVAWHRLNLSVAVEGSDEAGDGSEARPLRTIPEALRRIRAARLASDALTPKAPAAVLLRAGVHSHSAPIVLTPDDSGVSIEPHPADTGRVTLSGGVRIDAKFRLSHFVGATAVLVADIPAGLTHATELFTANGTRLTRARWPNAAEAAASGSLTPLANEFEDEDKDEGEVPPLGTIVQPFEGDFAEWIPAEPYTFPHFAYVEGGSLAERYAYHRSPAVSPD